MSDMLLYNIFDSAAVCTNKMISDKLESIAGLKFTVASCGATDTCAVECEQEWLVGWHSLVVGCLSLLVGWRVLVLGQL